MGRPKGSTVHSDTKIILALLYKPRRFSEFEWALVEEFGRDLPKDVEIKYAEFWKRFVRSWRIPKKTLARRLKALMAKGWVIRKVLWEHGHHVEYSLNFSKDEEMLKELPIPSLHLAERKKRLERTIEAIVLLREKFPSLRGRSREEIVETYLRLRSGEVCPTCLRKGVPITSLNFRKDGAHVYCTNCGEEFTWEESKDAISKIVSSDLLERFRDAMQGLIRFLGSIDKQRPARKATQNRVIE